MSGLDLKTILILSVGIVVGQVTISYFLNKRRLNQSSSLNYNSNSTLDSNKINKKVDNNFSPSGVQNNSKTSIFDDISKGLSDIGKKV